MMSAELLPCPCCNSKPRLVDLAGYEIICDCGISMCLDGIEKEPLVTAWNRRSGITSQTLPPKLNESPLSDVRATVGEAISEVRRSAALLNEDEEFRSGMEGACDQIEDALRAADKGEASHTDQQSAKPVAWMREWEGDDSDLGKMLFETEESELDNNPNWIPLYDHRHSQSNGSDK